MTPDHATICCQSSVNTMHIYQQRRKFLLIQGEFFTMAPQNHTPYTNYDSSGQNTSYHNSSFIFLNSLEEKIKSFKYLFSV